MRYREPVSDIEGEEFVVKLLANDELVSLTRRHLAAGTSPIIPQKSPASPPKKSPLFPQKKILDLILNMYLTPASPSQPTTTTSPSLKRQIESPLTVRTLFTPLPQTQPQTAPKTCHTGTKAVAHSPSMQVPGKVFGKFSTHCQTIAPARRMATINSNTTRENGLNTRGENCTAGH